MLRLVTVQWSRLDGGSIGTRQATVSASDADTLIAKIRFAGWWVPRGVIGWVNSRPAPGDSVEYIYRSSKIRVTFLVEAV